ncbi:hypothetical protein [Elizabethkingia ursingii]|uniref:Uncharacterized protein n=1 Tax=Elizabethkingia ursingii TaxID=1756150 RepID=A0AAJ3NCZ0_9FLAO|nr:hypothetical protein [Elizabethkingia ursingii]AQX09675.1 hypothetical protein BBD34_13955 [Elizabethkingia ursingii]OPB75408.1 hypothetical protein BAY32_07710 [Elizabethkingia ursingii]
MKKILLYSIFLLLGLSKAQTLPLSSSIKQINNCVYLKDVDNILPLFSGQWTANYEGGQVILALDERENYPVKFLDINYTSDVLLMRYAIKDSQGKEIYSTLNKDLADKSVINSVVSSIPPNKMIGFIYKGEECGIGAGHIFLTQIDATHIRWEYRSTGGLIDSAKCTNYSPNIKSYIPRTLDLTFIKQ